MTSKYVSGLLIIVLGVAFSTPARAAGNSLVTEGEHILIAIVAVTAVAVVATVAVIHYSKKRAITGCVNFGTNGMTVTDDKDKKIYALSGNTTGIKPGDRMKLQGRKAKPKGPDKTLVWEAREVTKDFGVCQP